MDYNSVPDIIGLSSFV